MKQKININKIKGNPSNPRIIKDEKFKKLVKSINGFPEMLEKRPIVVDEDMMVLGGNMRWKACKDAGLKEVWIDVAEGWTQEQKDEFIIKDNANFGEWDWDILANEWDSVQLAEWGLDVWENEDDKIAEIGLIEDDEIPEVKESKVKRGDIWKLGEHRIMCGDSTRSDDVEKLMNGEKADISFTSPPYNTKENAKLSSHQENGTKYNSYDDNKTDEEYLKLLTGFTNNTLMFSEYSFVNIQSLSGNKVALIDFLYTMKELYADTLIWNKQTAQPAMAKNVLNSQYEYIHCFSKKANRAIGVSEFRGTISNVVEISKQSSNKVKSHNATFPIDFALFFVSNFSKNTVLDLFLGSGTTLIAAEKTNRKCYGMELDEKYCDVIIERWEQFTGQKAIKNGTK